MQIKKRETFGEVLIKKEGSGAVKEAIAKLSRGLMLPIAMLPIAGLSLGIGTTIVSQASSEIGRTIGNMLMMPGSVIFAILPVLFAIAIAITFTNDSGTAGLSAIVGYAVFSIFQTALIIDRPDGYHDFLWYHFDQNLFDSLFTNIIGIHTLSSSIFGGIVVGGLVAFLYKTFKNIQLPKLIGFFNGVRFIPIVTFGASCVLGMIFAMIWPIIGIGLYYMGIGLAYAGEYGGVNSLIYGIFNRMLVPFGLHHILNTTLWFTSVGGTLNTNEMFWFRNVNGVWTDSNLTYAMLAHDTIDSIVNGDINIQIEVSKMVGKTAEIPGLQYITVNDIIASYNHVHGTTDHSLLALGQYTNFAYVIGLFALPGAALGMLMAAPKGDGRKLAASIVIPGALVSSLTGVSEAIEFTFLFLAPWLFWGFHAVMSGIAGMITTTLIYYAPGIAPHVTFSFAQGFLDFVVYGVMPDARGGGTNCWVLLIMSAIYFPIYFGVFYWAIKKWNIQTPGRGNMTKLFTKSDWLKKQNEEKVSDKPATMRDKAMEVMKAYGGPDNILNIDACITKLRIQVKDKKTVNSDRLKQLGALGVIHPSPQSVYAVFGNEADIIKNLMKDIIAKGEYKGEEKPTTPVLNN